MPLGAHEFIDALINKARESVLILNNPNIERSKSKKVELLAKFHGYTTGQFLKWLKLLTLDLTCWVLCVGMVQGLEDRHEDGLALLQAEGLALTFALLHHLPHATAGTYSMVKKLCPATSSR